MSIATNNSRVYAAKQFKDKQNSMYVALGKTSAWTDEANPPLEAPTTSDVTEIIGYKKVTSTQLCRDYKSGDETGYTVVSYGGKKYTIVPDDKRYAEKAWYVFVKADIGEADFDPTPFRQVGLYIDLTPKSGVTKTNLKPSDVSSKGVLQAFTNQVKQQLDGNTMLTSNWLFSFDNTKSLG